MEFVYNNAPSTTTSVFPFFANKRYYPNITVHSKHNIASSWAHNFAIDLDELQSTLKAEISAAQQHYQKSTDVKHSSTLDFKVGDKVFVKTKFFWTLSLQRNSPKNISDPMKLLPNLVHYCSPSTFQSPCTLFIQPSIYPCSNLLHLILSPREYNWHLL